jgi:uncharacterized membrane protein YphA (DoxX/SURF4 family)
MFEKRILNIYSVIIGALFIISGIGKVIDTTAFSNLIYQYGLGYFMILSPLIVLVEILLGLFLILLINPKRYSMISFFLLIIFTISFIYAHFKHGVTDCGCFGSLQHTNLPPIFIFIRNFILLTMSLILWIKYPKEDIETAKWKKYLVWLVICPAIFISGFTFSVPAFLKNNSNKHKFQDQNIKNTELSKYFKTSPDSSYLIFCFSYTCPHCLNSIENLRQYKKSNTVDNVVSLATGSDSTKLFFEQNFHPDFYVKNLSMEEMNKLTNSYPTTFYIKHDSIKVVIQGELPSHVLFKKQHNIKF